MPDNNEIKNVTVFDPNKADMIANHYTNLYEKGTVGQALSKIGYEAKVTPNIENNPDGSAEISFHVETKPKK